MPRRTYLPPILALAATSLVAALLGGCGPGADAGPGAGESARGGSGVGGRGAVRVVVVTHGQVSDPFWSVVANGVRAAARDLGIRAEYQAPRGFDMVEMSELIEAAVASRPSGLVVSIPDPDALGGPIRAAVAAGIPVLSINSGGDASAELGVLAHIGQTEYEAGYGAGERMAAAAVARALCVNQEVGNVGLDHRCQGFRDALAERGGTARVLAVNLADPEEAQQRIGSALRSDRSIDGVLTLGPTGADPALAALEESGRAHAIAFATFDLSPRVLDALEGGRMLFAIDQQQYLQGYLGVLLLAKYIETGAIPGGGEVIRTGPGFVTPENAAAVRDLTARGIR